MAYNYTINGAAVTEGVELTAAQNLQSYQNGAVPPSTNFGHSWANWTATVATKTLLSHAEFQAECPGVEIPVGHTDTLNGQKNIMKLVFSGAGTSIFTKTGDADYINLSSIKNMHMRFYVPYDSLNNFSGIRLGLRNNGATSASTSTVQTTSYPGAKTNLTTSGAFGVNSKPVSIMLCPQFLSGLDQANSAAANAAVAAAWPSLGTSEMNYYKSVWSGQSVGGSGVNWNPTTNLPACRIRNQVVAAGAMTIYIFDMLLNVASTETPKLLMRFDDGSEGHYNYLLPIVKKYGVPTTYSMPMYDQVEGESGAMSAEDAVECYNNGVDIVIHSDGTVGDLVEEGYARATARVTRHRNGYREVLGAAADQRGAKVFVYPGNDSYNPFSVTQATPVFTGGVATVSCLTDTPLYAGDTVVFTTAGTLPANITSGQTYYVTAMIGANADKFTFAATPGGVDIVPASAGTGTHTVTFVGDQKPLVRVKDMAYNLGFRGNFGSYMNFAWFGKHTELDWMATPGYNIFGAADTVYAIAAINGGSSDWIGVNNATRMGWFIDWMTEIGCMGAMLTGHIVTSNAIPVTSVNASSTLTAGADTPNTASGLYAVVGNIVYVSASTIPSMPNGTYYIASVSVGGVPSKFTISSTRGGAAITANATGSMTITIEGLNYVSSSVADALYAKINTDRIAGKVVPLGALDWMNYWGNAEIAVSGSGSGTSESVNDCMQKTFLDMGMTGSLNDNLHTYYTGG
jgi:hypothetical protein